MDNLSLPGNIRSPNKDSPLAAAPLYRRIHHELRDLIASGKLLPGDPIPPEKELAKKYGVSRFTIQQVFRLLVQEGLVFRRQGLGTFIRELESTQSSNRLTLRLGGLQCVGVFQLESLRHFSRRVAELTRNQVNIDFCQDTFFDSAAQQLSKLSSGEQDLFSASTEWIEGIEPTWGITSLPFLFQSMEHVHQFTKSLFAESLRQKLLGKSGIRVLADNWVRPSRLILSKRPCFEVQDYRGMHIRVPDIKTYRIMWQALGARPVPMPWNEIPSGIRDGKIDSIDAPRDIVHQEKFHRHARFITNTQHIFPRACILISEKRFQHLRPDVQDILVIAATEAGESYSANALSKWQDDKRKMILEGARIIDTDPTPLRRKTAALYRPFSEALAEVEAILEKSIDPERDETVSDIDADL